MRIEIYALKRILTNHITATYTETQWLDNAEPDDMDMGGLSDFDDFDDFE